MADLAPGSTFAGYRIEGVIAQGGMGVVYRAVHPKLERTVALKVIRPPLVGDEEFRRRFARESQAAAQLDHPNVVPIHDADEHEGVPFLVMRYVDGHDLRTLIREQGPLSPERAARIVVQVASALDAAHEAGLVHRDVKPANVLLTARDHVYLTDFGLTKRLAHGDEATLTGTMLGTLNWIAPEQIRGEGLGAHTDVYALGCVLFHLLTAKVPFPVETEGGKLWAHQFQQPPVPSTIAPGVPSAFDAVVRRALAKRPEDRYPSAGDLGGAAMAAAISPARPADRRLSRRGGAMAARRAQGVAPPEVQRRAMLPRALGDPFALALLVGMLVAGALIGALLAVLVPALVLYTASVARVYLDDDVRRSVAERAGAGTNPPATVSPPAERPPVPRASIDEMVEEAVEKKELLQEAIEARDLRLPGVSRALDEFGDTMLRTAEGAQLIHEELGGSSPEAIAGRTGDAEADNAGRLEALRHELSDRDRMQNELERARTDLKKILLVLDSLSDELLSATRSTAIDKEERLAAEVRDLRIEAREVADDLAGAAGEESRPDAGTGRDA